MNKYHGKDSCPDIVSISTIIHRLICWLTQLLLLTCFRYDAAQQVSSSLFPIIFDTSQLLTVFDSPLALI